MTYEDYINKASQIIYGAHISMEYGPLNADEDKPLALIKEDIDTILNQLVKEIYELRHP